VLADVALLSQDIFSISEPVAQDDQRVGIGENRVVHDLLSR
jgi:hypothetical protein